MRSINGSRTLSTQAQPELRLALPNEQRLETLFSWFTTDHDIAIWGGPAMRLPMTFDTMKTDARVDELASLFLVDATSVLGFGQYYLRLNHCHVGRLVIAPDRRGQQLGQTLIDLLTARGKAALNVRSESLFVLKDNVRAKRLYERLGFVLQHYPGNDIDLEGILYMTRTP